MSDWWKVSAAELAQAYRERRASPVEVIDEFLRRCAELNPAINAVVTLDAVGARAAALASEGRWRAGSPLSDFDGIPVTVKDSILVQGMRSTWGSRLYADLVPARDELPVARLRAAGAVIAGKTNVPEFTLQGYTANPLFGVTRNPWNPALTPGGSSGGAVASVAMGLGPLALGTDGGGSTRRPASYTGLLGLKPSRGRIPRSDGFPAILLDFEVLGLIARTVADIEGALRLVSEPDSRDPGSLAFARVPFAPAARRACRILYAPRVGDAPVDPEIAASVAAAARTLESLGHRVEEANRFDVPRAANEAWPVISQVGLAWLLAGQPDWRKRVGPSVASMAEAGLTIAATHYFEALDAAARTRESLRALFTDYDLLLTPTAAALPWPANETHPARIAGRDAGPRGHAVFTAFVNAGGYPALSVPCGPSSGGLPIGFQLVAPYGEDGLLCTVARQFEDAQPWAMRWPELCSRAAAA